MQDSNVTWQQLTSLDHQKLQLVLSEPFDTRNILNFAQITWQQLTSLDHQKLQLVLPKASAVRNVLNFAQITWQQLISLDHQKLELVLSNCNSFGIRNLLEYPYVDWENLSSLETNRLRELLSNPNGEEAKSILESLNTQTSQNEHPTALSTSNLFQPSQNAQQEDVNGELATSNTVNNGSSEQENEFDCSI